VGDVYCEFEQLEESQREVLALHAERRRFSSRVWVERISVADSGEQLLAHILTAVVELAECQRGFLLVGDGHGEMTVRARYNLLAEDMSSGRFEGSRGALDKALRERRLVLMTAADDRAWLRQQASVVALGLRSLVCLPLEHDGELVGAVYADSDILGRVFTTLDAQLLRAFAQQAALTLAAARVDGRLAALQHDMTLELASGRTET
jgi:GAF domain-containing protein